MNRRHFFGCLAALPMVPFVPIPELNRPHNIQVKFQKLEAVRISWPCVYGWNVESRFFDYYLPSNIRKTLKRKKRK